MDTYYNPNDLIQIQLMTVAVGVGLLVFWGLILTKRQIWLPVTLL